MDFIALMMSLVGIPYIGPGFRNTFILLVLHRLHPHLDFLCDLRVVILEVLTLPSNKMPDNSSTTQERPRACCQD